MHPLPVSNDAGSGPHASLRGEEKLERKLKSARVMIVEDSAFMRKLIRGLLTSVGIGNVLEAADGLAALRAVNSFEPDIILLDWEMPVVDGRRFVQIFQSRKAIKHRGQIIFLSAFSEQWRVLDAKTNGIGTFLVKPVSALALRGRIASLLRSRKIPEAVTQNDDAVVLID
jgi:two-component system, chemotaxis family, chemotaxis protein CheY